MTTGDQPAPIAGMTARDIASHYTYSASRVQLHVVDPGTVLAVGFADKPPNPATGRLASIVWVTGRWSAMRVVFSMSGRPISQQAELDTTDDLDALMRWLRGEP